MPRYDYRCKEGDVTEAVREMSVTEIACPSCGGVAQRQAVYANQHIRGETVARPRLGSSIKNKHGQFKLGLYAEAQSEIIHDSEKAGIEPPDLWKQGKEKAARAGALLNAR